MDGWMEPSVHLIMLMIRADWSISKDIGPGFGRANTCCCDAVFTFRYLHNVTKQTEGVMALLAILGAVFSMLLILLWG